MADKLPDPVPDVVVDPIIGASQLRQAYYRWWVWNQYKEFVATRYGNPTEMSPEQFFRKFTEKPVDNTG